MKSDNVHESGVGYVVVLRTPEGTPFTVIHAAETISLSIFSRPRDAFALRDQLCRNGRSKGRVVKVRWTVTGEGDEQ